MAFQILQASGLTQQAFANRVGIAQAAISQYLSGIREPSPQVLQKISTAFSISINDVLEINAASDLQEAAILMCEALCKNLTTKQIQGLIDFLD